MRKVLLLDIDYTVIKTDSMIDFIVFSIKKDFRNSIIYIKSFFLIVAYIFKLKTIEEVKSSIFKYIEKMEEKDLKAFFEERLFPKIYPSMREVIEKSIKDDYYIIMVTASPIAYMRYFEEFNLAHKVIGTELALENNRYKSTIIGLNCKGEEKVKRIKDVLEKENIEIDFTNSYAYSDSKSDLPMLNLVANKFYVNKKNGKFTSVN